MARTPLNIYTVTLDGFLNQVFFNEDTSYFVIKSLNSKKFDWVARVLVDIIFSYFNTFKAEVLKLDKGASTIVNFVIENLK